MSPDLSPVENAWGIMKYAIAKRAPNTASQLERVAKEEWRRVAMNKGLLDRLFDSMQGRLKEVVKAKGGAIAY